jgi:hypothetical protein
MIGSSHLYGGFSISPALARRMFEAVAEIHAQAVDLTLSHVDDDNCDVCRATRAAEAAAKEERHDAPAPDRPGREWAA